VVMTASQDLSNRYKRLQDECIGALKAEVERVNMGRHTEMGSDQHRGLVNLDERNVTITAWGDAMSLEWRVHGIGLYEDGTLYGLFSEKGGGFTDPDEDGEWWEEDSIRNNIPVDDLIAILIELEHMTPS
jgi:hypothetical protein